MGFGSRLFNHVNKLTENSLRDFYLNNILVQVVLICKSFIRPLLKYDSHGHLDWFVDKIQSRAIGMIKIRIVIDSIISLDHL